MEAGDGGLCGFRVQFTKHRPLAFPLWEFVVLVVLTGLVVFRTVFVVPADVVVELAMNVEMVFQSLRYLLCRVSMVAVTVFHRCLLVRDMLT